MKGLCERGVTLIETMLAVLIAVVGVFGLGNLVFQATVTSKNQGTETTRAVIYAQDKIEKLLSFSSVPTNANQSDFATCTQAPSSQPAVCNSSGVTSATGWTTGLVAGGVTGPLQVSCPASGASVGYMDFLDTAGCQIDACASPPVSLCGLSNPIIAYVRMWQISDLAPGTNGTLQQYVGGPVSKQLTVYVYSLTAVNTNAGKPIVVLSSVASNPN
jgi:Tfp pilus assembly protein PilV